MRTTQTLLRSGLTVAAAAALPLTLAAPSAVAVGGISVSTTGSNVSVTTSACPSNGGSYGSASLLSSGQANFSQGRQATLTGTSTGQSASWSGVSPGTYTVIVVCADGTTAGTQSVIVSAAANLTPNAATKPTISTTTAPSRGVAGGFGGTVKDYGTVTLVGGAVLVATGTVAAAWFLRRRAKPHRL
ncbi:MULTISPECIES: hypothetical protein [Streptomyces]|uniref:Secreted protein n=1 Tax=Streptomyces dengpaensis TaxID=2049881 RepID=A0ABN5IDT3_9ACTN|nr:MULTISPECIES: hypothetical protein [Streptomyces]AVH60420.1 hypothetical protein C4B68_36720 [Streptomyces dengpaensis]PIB07660.1 hypothetical protein B1C81_19315 [Streptomyces sp. HG99]